jgi:DNA modification methylase
VTTTDLAIIDYRTGEVVDQSEATAEQLRQFAIAVRETFDEKTCDELEAVEALLTAVSKRLRQLGAEKVEAERSRTLALQRAGQLLKELGEQRGGDRRSEDFQSLEMQTLKKAQRQLHYIEGLLRDYPHIVKREWPKPGFTLNRAITACRFARAEKEKTAAAETVPLIEHGDACSWLAEQDDCDLLLTDPPYSTDVDDVYAFASEWLPLALKKVKPTGRAYVCIGAYPAELHAYLSVPTADLTLANVLVWTYRNTLGPAPSIDYKLNWQAILYYRGAEVPALDSPRMVEQFSVADINAPDGRLGDRVHAWQKPAKLGERFVRHATKPGQLVLDPFAGTGTFLAEAARLGRVARGCDLNEDMLALAVERGCQRA